MLRSESNSSITTTQPTIGWQSLSLPLASYLFSLLLLHSCFGHLFKITCFIHRVWLHSYPTELVLPNLNSDNVTHSLPVYCKRRCDVSAQTRANTLLIGWSVLLVRMCLDECASLSTPHILGSGVCYCMLVKKSFSRHKIQVFMLAS